MDDFLCTLNKENELLLTFQDILENQRKAILNNDVGILESSVKSISKITVEMVSVEKDKRRIQSENNININDVRYLDAINYIKKNAMMVKFQNDTNEVLIRQKSVYLMNMLKVVDPRFKYKTYNSKGKIDIL